MITSVWQRGALCWDGIICVAPRWVSIFQLTSLVPQSPVIGNSSTQSQSCEVGCHPLWAKHSFCGRWTASTQHRWPLWVLITHQMLGHGAPCLSWLTRKHGPVLPSPLGEMDIEKQPIYMNRIAPWRKSEVRLYSFNQAPWARVLESKGNLNGWSRPLRRGN